MTTDFTFISELISAFISMIFEAFANVDLSPINSALQFVSKYIQAALYILPSQTVSQIFAIVCVIWSLSLFVKTLATIWSLIPIL